MDNTSKLAASGAEPYCIPVGFTSTIHMANDLVATTIAFFCFFL
jgi:hypothetical protein